MIANLFFDFFEIIANGMYGPGAMGRIVETRLGIPLDEYCRKDTGESLTRKPTGKLSLGLTIGKLSPKILSSAPENRFGFQFLELEKFWNFFMIVATECILYLTFGKICVRICSEYIRGLMTFLPSVTSPTRCTA